MAMIKVLTRQSKIQSPRSKIHRSVILSARLSPFTLAGGSIVADVCDVELGSQIEATGYAEEKLVVVPLMCTEIVKGFF